MPQLKLSPITYFFSAFAALFLSGVGVASVDAMAAAPAYYQVELAAPTDAAKFVARDIPWNCAGTTCTAPRGASRPAVICAALVRKVGDVTAFRADDKTLDADALAKCNAKG